MKFALICDSLISSSQHVKEVEEQKRLIEYEHHEAVAKLRSKEHEIEMLSQVGTFN